MDRNQLLTTRLAWRLASCATVELNQTTKTRYRISRGRDSRRLGWQLFSPPPLSRRFICLGGWYHQLYWSSKSAGEKKKNTMTFSRPQSSGASERTILYKEMNGVPVCIHGRRIERLSCWSCNSGRRSAPALAQMARYAC